MDRQERVELYRTYIRTILSRESSLFRYLTFSYPPGEDAMGRTPVQVIIDGQAPGILRLLVRSASTTAAQEAMLKAHGFEPEFDTDDPRFTVYARHVEGASIEDLVTFVEWVYRVVFDAPPEYMPEITPIGKSAEEKRSATSCAKSCMNAIALLWMILVALLFLYFVLRGTR